MEARQLKSREYNTDIFNTRGSGTNGAAGLYDPHPFLKDRVNSDNRTRTSFQDSNIFGYKEDKNVTWQGTGRDDRPAGIRTETYALSYHSPDNVLYNPEAGMAAHSTQAQKTYVEPEREMYFYNDPRVPKSRLGEEVFGTREFNRAEASKDLMAGDKHWLRHADFTRDHEVEGITPEERKQRELVGQISDYQATAPALKTRELRHETLSSWTDPNKADKRSNVVQDINTFERRAQELSSINNPLTATDYSEYIPKTKQDQITENIEQRVRDAMYSDLYGQTGKYGPKAKVAQRSEISSHTGIFSKEGTQKGTRWSEDLSAAERRQEFLRTTGFPVHYEAAVPEKKVPSLTEINLARSQLRMPKVLKAAELEARRFHDQNYYDDSNLIRDNREINVINLRFKNLPKETDEECLRVMSGAKHIVRASVKTDNIKNECIGEGEITIRLADGESKEDIISRYTSAGVIAEDKPETERK